MLFEVPTLFDAPVLFEVPTLFATLALFEASALFEVFTLYAALALFAAHTLFEVPVLYEVPALFATHTLFATPALFTTHVGRMAWHSVSLDGSGDNSYFQPPGLPDSSARSHFSLTAGRGLSQSRHSARDDPVASVSS